MAKTPAFKRIWLPAVFFLGFLAFAFFGEGLLGEIGAEALSQSKKILLITVQLGIWLSAAIFVNRMISVFIWDGIVARATGAPVPKLLRDVVGALIFLTAISGIVAFVFGKDVTGIVAASSIVGLVVGMALQSVILDLFIGLALNIERPYKIGDYVSVHPKDPNAFTFGQIIEISWRTTRLQTTEDNVVVLPNSLIGSSMVTNVSQPSPPRRLEISITLDPAVPVERVRRVLLGAALSAVKHKGLVDDPRPVVLVSETNAFGIEYQIRFYSQMGTGKSQDQVLTRSLENLKQAGIGLAYPKQDVFHAPMPERHVDASSTDGLAKLLKRIPLFEFLEHEDLMALAGDMGRQFYKIDESLIRMGDAGDSMFVLVEGLLEVFALAGEDGNEILVAEINPGQFFGEMSMLTGERRSATVKAVTDAVAYEITKSNIQKMLQRRPELAERISSIVASRKLANVKALSRAPKDKQDEERESLANQILGKMKNFFSFG